MASKTRFIFVIGPQISTTHNFGVELCRALDSEKDQIRAIQDQLNAPLKHLVTTALGDTWNGLDHSKMRAELNGGTTYQLTDWMRNNLRLYYGSDVLGRWLLHRCFRNPLRKPDFVVVDDGYILDEVEMFPNRTVVAIPPIPTGLIGLKVHIELNPFKVTSDMYTEADRVAREILG